MPIPGAIISGSVQLINGTVNNLMRNKVYQQQVKNLDFQTKLQSLSNQQQFVLAQRLQNAKTDTERLKILLETSSEYDLKQSELNSAKNLAYVFLGGSLVLFFVVYLIKRKT
jgi:hypothetical protein